MKIGIDLDNTITEMPWFFSIITAGLLAKGHEVHIITYRDGNPQDTIEELKSLDINYTTLHLPNKNDEMSQWKAKLAVELGLDLMIEDSPENLAAMPPNVQRMWLCNPEVYNLKACIASLHAQYRMAKIW